MRKIIHIDMDAFFASVEQRDDPALKGKPIAVGGSSERGVVAAASYEARKFGVRSAMSSKVAARKCPDLIFVHPRFDAYKAVSKQIREIFYSYTDLVEPLSLDEAYLDVTHNKKQMLSATHIAIEIRKQIELETKLTASAGISINKFLAKTASDVNKPNGQFVITPEKAESFVEKLKIERFFGIGKVTAQKMRDLGIHNGLDLKQRQEKELVRHFGKVGHYYFQIARAIDERQVNPNRIIKSQGAENTFSEDLTDIDNIKVELSHITNTLIKRLQKSNTKGHTLTLKVKYADFKQITRSKTVDYWIENGEHIRLLYEQLLPEVNLENGVRLLGLTLSNLNHNDTEVNTTAQLTLEF